MAGYVNEVLVDCVMSLCKNLYAPTNTALARSAEHVPHKAMRDTDPIEPIALVGLSMRLPGGANDTDSLWKLLESGKPAWTPVPADRYNGDVSTAYLYIYIRTRNQKY